MFLYLHPMHVFKPPIQSTYNTSPEPDINPPLPDFLRFPHVHHTPNTVARLHILKRSIDLRQRLPVRDELVDLQLARHVIAHQVRQLATAFDTAESAALPLTAGDELECCEDTKYQR